MKYFNHLISILIILLFGQIISAQIKLPDYYVETGADFYKGQDIPFWQISNQYGLVNPHYSNQWLIAGTHSHLDPAKKIDYDYGLDLVNRYSNNNSIYLQQGYVRLKYFFINIQGGVLEEKFGNQDSSLSSGGLYWSGNARPMPKISIMVPNYTPVPYTGGYVEFKGGISHGWFENNEFNKNAWLHHKFVYVQFGGDLPVHVHFGLHQFTQWGGEVTSTGQIMPHSFQNFIHVFLLKDMNQLWEKSRGSRNFGADIDIGDLKVDMYWQTLIEDGTGIAFVNISDGLWGLSIHSKNKNHLINRFVYEYVKTTNQSGPYDYYWVIHGVKYYNPPDTMINPYNSKLHHEAGGNDNYFNGPAPWYGEGWTYYQMCIGTPLVTSPLIQQGTINYIGNNKIQANHVGFEGLYGNFSYKLLYTYSINYGLNTTTPGLYGVPTNTFNPPKTQNSFLLKTSFSNLLPWKIILGVSLGIDRGQMYGNNTGLIISLIKTGV